MRQIIINACLNGYIVQVGCQTIVFPTQYALVSELIRYLESPEKVEQEFLKKARYPNLVNIPQNEQARRPQAEQRIGAPINEQIEPTTTRPY